MDAKKFLIYCDMDGTMLSDWSLGPFVPEKNLRAMRRFMDAGGAISIASGRQLDDVMIHFPGLYFNAPLVLGNGTLIQDCRSRAVYFESPLTRAFKEASLQLAERLDYVFLLPNNHSNVTQVLMGDGRDHGRLALARELVSREEYLSSDAFIKMVYVLEDDRAALMPTLEAAVRETPILRDMLINKSSPVFLETYNPDAGKARGVRRAAELAGMSGRTLVCIGDYFNDADMLAAADIAVCPSNAPQEIQAMCSIITCDNNEGAVGDLIERLEAL